MKVSLHVCLGGLIGKLCRDKALPRTTLRDLAMSKDLVSVDGSYSLPLVFSFKN